MSGRYGTSPGTARGAADFLVVGGGIAGAAAGYFLARHGRVVLLEAERSPGLHATGRSAALFSEYFGNPTVRALTIAARGFYTAPPDGFTTAPLLTPRGVLALETPGTAAQFEAAKVSGATAPQPVVELDEERALDLCPALLPGAFGRALYKPGACDVDVDATHQGFLRGLRAAGGSVVTGARVHALRRDAGEWQVSTAVGEFAAPVVVNAAGAWADELARLARSAGVRALGLVPRRRTAALARTPDGADASSWPMVSDVADTFYAKPESGGLLLSPVDDTPEPPGDIRARDLDVATAVHRFEQVSTLRLRHVGHIWAGLRTSTPDDTPVIGTDPRAPGFCWLAGLGGYGIQTAPAAGALLAALATGNAPPPALAALVPGLTPARDHGPDREEP
ncbi:FAD-binding oxidoreductase [Streptomyces sp. N2-109]|uniref:FAD-binding oxidoreductase n=1 Tax=Streptomyces gossypii TaxID=2883101 RepID=A0ABT2JQ21_9ACTN|nr:FAD-binding oxidoreductase [Streptomyces gossypii]MCT2589970.1 FAD-binding oxidoreductase [Streptomyces gossypii]